MENLHALEAFREQRAVSSAAQIKVALPGKRTLVPAVSLMALSYSFWLVLPSRVLSFGGKKCVGYFQAPDK